MLALLTTSLPLRMVLTSKLVAVSAKGELLVDPQPHAVRGATSLHVFGFSSHGDLMVSESEGVFSLDVWDQAYDQAEQSCRGSSMNDIDQAGDVNMEFSQSYNLEDSIKNALQEKLAKEQRWKDV